MEVILDTNFIIACVRKKIDFIEELSNQGFKILLPREVYHELKDVRLKSSSVDRAAIDIALMLVKQKKLKGITLGGTTVDQGLMNLGKQGAYIATLDTAIKRAVPNRVVIAGAQNALVIERS